jgi:hypothetical protein
VPRKDYVCVCVCVCSERQMREMAKVQLKWELPSRR